MPVRRRFRVGLFVATAVLVPAVLLAVFFDPLFYAEHKLTHLAQNHRLLQAPVGEISRAGSPVALTSPPTRSIAFVGVRFSISPEVAAIVGVLISLWSALDYLVYVRSNTRRERQGRPVRKDPRRAWRAAWGVCFGLVAMVIAVTQIH